MPKRRRSTFKKRSFSRKKRRVSRKRRVMIPRNLIPTKTVRRFRYATTLNLDPAAGLNPAFFAYNANGMFDPEQTGLGGHQPMGFDQYVGVLYDHFTVIASKITVTFTSKSNNASTGTCRVGITPKDQPTMTLSTNSLIEQGRTKTAIVSALTSNNTRKLSYKINPNKFLGISKPMSSSLVRGTNAADPDEGCYWIVWCANVDGVSDSLDVLCTILIEYTAVLTEPKFLTGS